MEADGAAAKLRIINDAIEAARRRRGWTIEEAIEHMRNGALEGRRRFYRTVQANAGLAEVDPWDLPPQFTMPKDQRSSSLRPRSGYWKEKEDEYFGIRSEGGGEGSSSPSYYGVMRTLEFYMHNGTKTDWVMREYSLLDDRMSIQEDVVIRKVFNKTHTNHRGPSYFNYSDRVLEAYYKSPAKHVDLQSECGESPTAPAARDGESDDVWQHFTRINTKDPNVVYAACHRCDRVLKAHSKNGTSHLRRHRESKICTSHSNPPSNAEELKILHELRANLNLYKQGEMQGWVDSPDLNSSVEPWDVPKAGYYTSLLSRKTHQGRWEESKSNDKLIAIRIGQLPVLQYAGLKRTLEFHHDDGTKTDWIMLEYHQVDELNTRGLLLEGSMVFRKVIQIFKDAVEELERMWNGDDGEEERCIGEREEEVKARMNNLLRDCLLGEDAQGDQSRVGKRKRTVASEGGSKVWLYFTKIYATDPDRVYAVCHSCDRGYKVHAKNGTSQFIRHNKSCSSKHRKV